MRLTFFLERFRGVAAMGTAAGTAALAFGAAAFAALAFHNMSDSQAKQAGERNTDDDGCYHKKPPSSN